MLIGFLDLIARTFSFCFFLVVFGWTGKVRLRLEAGFPGCGKRGIRLEGNKAF